MIETGPIILDIALVLILAGTMGFFARKLGLPAILGYLFTGLLVSPFTPGYVTDAEQITLLADIGVAILLFEVGIEINIRRITNEQRALIWSPPLQVLIGLAGGTAILYYGFDVSIFGSLLVALSIAMSSSVVIVNITRSSRRTTNPETEDALLGWSIIQDLAGVATAGIILAIFQTNDEPIYSGILKLIGFGIVAIISAQLMKFVLRQVRWEKDLFLIYSVAIGLILSGVGSVFFEIPVALAAFVSGLVINQNRDTEEVRKSLLPFRDLFAVFFFVVIGSLIKFSQFQEAIPYIIIFTILIALLKTLPVFVLAKTTGIRAKPLQLGLGLSQIGEFSYVLGGLALARKEITEVQFTALIFALIISIVLSTLLVRSKKFAVQKQ